ncbi:MAG: hypothetical protein MMC33_007067 [Icmadophila ericetorum]|nr:hypothetical protein [Icmadophila ericetorum]
MVYFKDSQDWVHQSTLLLQARPTSTRITTKYKLLPQNDPSLSVRRHSKAPPSGTTHPSDPPPHPPSRAFLVLKTFDPVSGTCLKYRTDKAAEVGRLVGGLGRCGRVMAGLKEKEGKMDVDGGEDEGGKVEGSGTATPVIVKKEEVPVPVVKKEDVKGGKGKAGGGGGGGGGKKKKGKK